MRNLTLKRKKTFVGCLMSMKLYIEDPESNELVIGGVPCRKLGKIRNGEEKTFVIDDKSAKIFVIGDKLSKDITCEYYQLPEGSEDIVLTGKNKFLPFAGNLFRFDNNTDSGALSTRKKGVKIGLIILIAAFVVGLILGLVAVAYMGSPKTFSRRGMTITLTNAFTEVDLEGFNACFDSEDIAVFATKDDYEYFYDVEDLTIEDYAEIVIESNEIESSGVVTYNGLTYFEYEYDDPEENDTYYYRAFVYASEDAFWTITFAAIDDYEDYIPKINEWAQSVEF